MQSTTVARSLRLPGYLIFALTALVPVVDVALRASPFRVHSPAWRLAFIATEGAAVATTLLALFLALALAAAAEDRGVSYAISSVSALCAMLCLLATGVFALDAVQVRAQNDPSISARFDVGSIWVAVRILLEALLFGILAVASFRRGKSIQSVAERAPTRRAAVLISPQRTVEPGVVASPPRSQKPVD